jgi:ankyrin repeat protein
MPFRKIIVFDPFSLGERADPNIDVDDGMPALHWAVAQHKPEHLKVLLEHGVNVDGMTSDDPPESVECVARRMSLAEELQILDHYRLQKDSRN